MVLCPQYWQSVLFTAGGLLLFPLPWGIRLARSHPGQSVVCHQASRSTRPPDPSIPPPLPPTYNQPPTYPSTVCGVFLCEVSCACEYPFLYGVGRPMSFDHIDLRFYGYLAPVPLPSVRNCRRSWLLTSHTYLIPPPHASLVLISLDQ